MGAQLSSRSSPQVHRTVPVSTRVYRAPGRVNLLGEHTDYNGGNVLPAAIHLACHVSAEPRDDRWLVIQSNEVDETAEISLDQMPTARSGRWFDYVVGVAASLEQQGFRLRGADLRIRSEVPLGSGLSSSAALETSCGYALLDLAGHEIRRRQLALLCQRAENEFVGTRCGVMDQLTACVGKADHALFVDCGSLDFQLVRIPQRVRLIVCNTMVRHELGSSEYNVRRAQCEFAVRILGGQLPHIRTLRDVSRQNLEECRAVLAPVLYKRVRHVIEENERVLRAGAALEQGELHRLGELMAQSHQSLKMDYEVSCPELDRMVEIAVGQTGVYGARMTGGGFGGSVIALVDAEHAASFVRTVGAAYERDTGLRPEIRVCQTSDGVGREA